MVTAPNIVLITVDCLRGDVVQDNQVSTPFLDKMARKGCSFEKHIATGAWTAPSFIGLMTGQQPHSYARDMSIHQYPETLAEVLRDMGYDTIATLDANYWISRKQGFDRGFDRFENHVDTDDFESEVTAEDQQNELAKRLPHAIVNRFSSTIDKTWEIIKNSNPMFEIARRMDMVTAASKRGVGAGEINSQFIDMLDDADRPVFGWVHYMDVHHPYLPERRGLRDRLRYPSTLTRYANNASVRNGVKLGDYVASYLKSLYERKVEEIDSHIEYLITNIRAVGNRDTVCIVMGDHGEEFREHGRFNHRNKPYNELVHVPFVVDGVNPATINQNTSAISVKPGIQALARGERDFAGTFEIDEPVVRYLIHSEDVANRTTAALDGVSEPSQVRAILLGDYKIYFDSEEEKISIYNLSTDFYEQTDLSGSDRCRNLERRVVREYVQETQELFDLMFVEEQHSC